MYLRKLRIRNVKLLRDVELDFTRDDAPRMWTAFIGENGLCKTALLQAIALAASGPDRANQLADGSALHDARHVDERAEIEAEFGFGPRAHDGRPYPGLPARPAAPPRIVSRLWLEPEWKIFQGASRYLDEPAAASNHDPLREARARGLPAWFVAGYGTTRALPKPSPGGRPEDLVVGRLDTLFDRGGLTALNFATIFSVRERLDYADTIQRLLGGDEGPASILFGQSGLSVDYLYEPTRSKPAAYEALPFDFAVRRAVSGKPLVHSPAAASQGIQSVIAWVSDLVGHHFVDARAALSMSDVDDFSGRGPVPKYQPVDLEGLVLLDEIDLHLHPSWQVKIVPALRKAFPNVQFITTTHSPMVLPGLERDEIVRLRQRDGGDVCVETPEASPALMTGSELYDSYFDIHRLYPNPLGDKLRRYGYLANDPTRSDDEEAALGALRAELEAAGVTFDWEPVAREPAS